jgi:hypothetical protein
VSASAPNDAYIEVMSAVVQRFVRLLGPAGVRPAKRIYGLRVSDDGRVTGYHGDGPVILQGLLIEYIGLLGSQAVPLTTRAIQPILARHPHLELPSLLR